MLEDTTSRRLDTDVQDLYQKIKGYNWLVSIGTGRRDGSPCIYVYTTKVSEARRACDHLIRQNIPIEFRRTSKVRVGKGM